MRFGLIAQMTGPLGYPQPLVRLAREAEAAGWDGVYPGSPHGNQTLDELHELRAFVQAQRATDAPFNVMVGGDVPFDDHAAARAILAEYAAAGVTWWVEGVGA